MHGVEAIAPNAKRRSVTRFLFGKPLASKHAAYGSDIGGFLGPESMAGTVIQPKGVLVDLSLEIPIGSEACETCAERGRPNEPVFKMGLCEFCYKGLTHPRATQEQLDKERMGGRYERSATSP